MTSVHDRLNFAVEIKPDDPSRTARLTGPAVADWSENAKVIWRVPYGADHTRLQEELILLAQNIKEGKTDALKRYTVGAQRYWRTSEPIYKFNRQKLADAIEPWRATVFAALLSPDSTDRTLAELAESAPSVEIKAEKEDMLPLGLLPVGAAPAAMATGTAGLIGDALKLPAFLGPVRYVPWGGSSAQIEAFNAQNGRHRSHCTAHYRIFTCLRASPFCSGTAT